MAEETRLELLDKLQYVQQELNEINSMQAEVLSMKEQAKIAINRVGQDPDDVEWEQIPYEDYYEVPNRNDYKMHVSQLFYKEGQNSGKIKGLFLKKAIFFPYMTFIIVQVLLGLLFANGVQSETYLYGLTTIVGNIVVYYLFFHKPLVSIKERKKAGLKVRTKDYIFLAIFVASVPVDLILGLKQAPIATVIGILAAAGVFAFFYYKARAKDTEIYLNDKKKVDELNDSIALENEAIRQQNESITKHNQNLDQINAEIAKKNAQKIENAKRKNLQIDKENRERKIRQAELAYDVKIRLENLEDEINGWYPPDYLTLHAVNFFVNAVMNHKADTIKELVNLYDNAMIEMKKIQTIEEVVKQAKDSNSNQQKIMAQLEEQNVMATQALLNTEIISKNSEHIKEYAKSAAENSEMMSHKMDNLQKTMKDVAAASTSANLAAGALAGMAAVTGNEIANNTRNIANNTKKPNVY